MKLAAKSWHGDFRSAETETNDRKMCRYLYYVYTIYLHIYLYIYAYLIIFVYHPYTSAIDLGILWLNPFYCVLSLQQFHRRCNRFISPRITFVFLCFKMDCIWKGKSPVAQTKHPDRFRNYSITTVYNSK